MYEPKDYLIEIRYLDGEWKKKTFRLPSVRYEVAARSASIQARQLDATYGGDHFWTVELHLDPKAPSGAFFQLFHGRTT
jgi:hypothetical protein